jgi:hypothetical protein
MCNDFGNNVTYVEYAEALRQMIPEVEEEENR